MDRILPSPETINRRKVSYAHASDNHYLSITVFVRRYLGISDSR
jgi:hypothetical protein